MRSTSRSRLGRLLWLGGLAVAAALAQAQPQLPRPPQLPPQPQVSLPPPPALPSPDSFFSGVKGKVVDGANQIDGWRRDASTAAGKRANDFAGCPSNDAQALYDRLRSERDAAQRTRDAAAGAERDAVTARDRCLTTPGMPAASCNAAYNTLPFAGQRVAAQAAVDELNRALDGLKNMRCVAGCNRQLAISVPEAQVGQGEPIAVAGEVCTAWDPGQFTARAGAAGGELSAEMRARLPRCRQTQRLALEACTAWDVAAALPQLKNLRIVPPSLDAGRVSINVPTVGVPVVNGFDTSCRRQETVCTRLQGNATIAFDSGDPLATLRSVGSGQCAESKPIGCAEPPFGVAPTMTTIQVPDLTRARVAWTSGDGTAAVAVSGPGNRITNVPVPAPQVTGRIKPPGPQIVQPGSAEVDFSRGEFRVACKQWQKVQLPTLRMQFALKSFDTPLCAEPRMGNLVARP
jgi:hypothetical protein